MKKILLSLLLLSTAGLFSCKNSGSADPKVVLGMFMEALAKKDIATARSLATAESKSMLDLMETSMKESDKANKDFDKYDKSKIQFGEARIDGDKAVVPVKEMTSGESMNYTLKKENGAWKVAFDKASLMGTMTDKMSEQGINSMDSLQKGMDEIKKINVDSLKQGMEQGMKSLDSATNELKKLQQ